MDRNPRSRYRNRRSRWAEIPTGCRATSGVCGGSGMGVFSGFKETHRARRHLTDHQMRLFMKYRQSDSIAVRRPGRQSARPRPIGSSAIPGSPRTSRPARATPTRPLGRYLRHRGRADAQGRARAAHGIDLRRIAPAPPAAGSRRTSHPRAAGPCLARDLGNDQEVIFRQVHEPGHLGLSDFTDMSKAA